MAQDSAPIKVLIVDFSPVVRAGLKSILDQAESFSILGESPDHTEAFGMVTNLKPDVVLTELRAETADGIELIRRLHEEYPELAVIVLTESDKNTDIADAVGAGASGYMLVHNIDERTLPEAIHLAQSNTSALDSGIIQRVLKVLKENARASLVSAGALSADLTDRELDVLRLMASGQTDREIANDLSISMNTVNRHVRNLVDKLGAGNRTRAALLAAEAGIIEVSIDGPEP